MTQRFRLPALALAFAIPLAVAAPASFAQTAAAPGQTDADHDAHHPGNGAQAGTSEPSAPPARAGGMPMGMAGGRGMMGGGDMDEMTSMMRGMMTMMMSGMATMVGAQGAMMSAHLDDRIAALRSELEITDAQTPQWDRFADALRGAATSMKSIGQMMMTMQPDGGTSLPVRLERQERILSTHLAAVRSIREALEPLYSSFSDDQKRTADRLMIGPMGMM